MKSPCRYPGCPSLVERSGYCPSHAHHANASRNAYDAKRRSSARLSGAAAVRDSARWKRVRALKLSANPMCEDPHGEHQRRNDTATASQIHHIASIKDNPEMAYTWDNLMSVCTRCHARLSAEERRADT